MVEEEIYIMQQEEFEVHGRHSHVCCLKRVLYVHKQAPRVWCAKIDSYLQGMGFTKCEADPNLYYIQVKSEPHFGAVCGLLISHRLQEDHSIMQGGPSNRDKHEGFGVNALFSGLGDVVDSWRDLPWTREVHN